MAVLSAPAIRPPESGVWKNGSEWESNPPQPGTQPATGFEDRGAHRDTFTPGGDYSAA